MKKLILHFLLALVLLNLSAATYTPKPGDIDGNGRINAIDCTLLARYLTGGPDIQLRAADANRDGLIDQADIDSMVDVILER